MSRRTRLSLIIIAVVSLAVTAVNVYSLTRPSKANSVALDIIPDWHGTGMAAFVRASNVQGSSPTGPADANFVVHAGVSVDFVIANLDNIVNENFTGPVTSTYTVYSHTSTGMVPTLYPQGQTVQGLLAGYSFTMLTPTINILIPPGSVVTFSHTFTKPGSYEYYSVLGIMPCMGLGYMVGSITVKG
jgi:hypothetical protein